jgi:hypothetical protein
MNSMIRSKIRRMNVSLDFSAHTDEQLEKLEKEKRHNIKVFSSWLRGQRERVFAEIVEGKGSIADLEVLEYRQFQIISNEFKLNAILQEKTRRTLC